MRRGPSLGQQFGWLWAAYSVSTLGTWLAFGAFPIIAIRVLHAGPAAVSALAATGLAVGALVAIPLGPWIEFRRKRRVMVAMDLTRFAAMASVPAAFALGWLSYGQLLVVSVVGAAADITFRAASGASVKALVSGPDLLSASARLESANWTASVLGPPLGGLAIGLLGPAVTVAADAVSYLLSAAGLGMIAGREPRPARPASRSGAAPPFRLRAGDLLEGWRFILGCPALRALFLNAVLVSALIMVSAPLLAVLMLADLHFAPWQFGLAFSVPCAGGLAGSRLSRRLADRYGRHRVLRVAGALRVFWPVGLAAVGRGVPGLALVMVLELGLITSAGVYNPVMVATQLDLTPPDRVARTLSAWTVSTRGVTAALTALWGVLASLAGPRAAIALAGVLLLATPLLLPRRDPAAQPVPEPAPEPA
jgi:hypothetical protein